MKESALPALVLDLDETLVFGSALPVSKDDDLSLPIKVGRRRMYIKFRPGLSTFLKEVSQYFEVFFFTASQPKYANQIIDAIAPETPKERRFFKSSCKSICGYPVKDLSLINSDQLEADIEKKIEKKCGYNFELNMKRTILVDDIEGSALLNPKNLIKIKEWNGDKKDEVLLNELLPFLIDISIDLDLTKRVSALDQDSRFKNISKCSFVT